MSYVDSPESVQNTPVEETPIEVPSVEKPIIIRKSLLQILIELFLGCTSKQSVKTVEELSEIKIEISIEEKKENEVSEINEIKGNEETNEIKENEETNETKGN